MCTRMRTRPERSKAQADNLNVRAFLASAGVAVEMYATTLHYALCHAVEALAFRTAVVLPRGTSEPLPSGAIQSQEDCLLRSRSKWLLAHPDTPEAADGAYIGLCGDNIRI